MMLLDLSRHTVRRNWAPYVGSFVALFLGVTLIGLTVEMISAATRYGATLPAGDDADRQKVEDLTSLFGTASGFSGFIAIFVVASTFSFVVSSRRREIGLLRLVGATPRQVRRMILGESLIVATVASVGGTLFAHLLSPAMLWLAADRGVTPVRLATPAYWLNLVIAAPIGILVALIGARAAARRASKISPIDSMREAAVDRRRLGFWRILFGTLFLAGSLTMLVLMGSINGEITLVLGIFAPEMLVISAVCFGPVVFPAFARLVAWPLMRRGDVSIRMARDNVAAAGKMTASLAAPTLAISAIAGSLIVTLGIAADYDHAVSSAHLRAPAVVQTHGDAAAVDALRHSSSARTVDAGVPLGLTMIDSEGERELEDAQAIDVSDAIAARTLTAKRGSLTNFHGNVIALSDDYIFDSGYHFGQRIKVAFKGEKPIRVKVVAIVRAAPSLQPELLVPSDLARAHGVRGVADSVFVVPAAGVSHPVAALNRELAGTPARAESATAWLDQADHDTRKNNQLGLWVILGPAGFYSALAIANTLLMGSLQRRREFVATLLIGATKRQLRRMVLWESALVTAAALTMGAIITATVGVLIRGSLSDGLTSMPVHVPWMSLGIIGATCLVVSAAAALAPTSSMLRHVHPSQAAD
ncbi:MAG: putative transport system permease protein [Nocardioidaceae bacterium]|nr:putative transport system permease protein [Nocardioidaceae bacterium]